MSAYADRQGSHASSSSAWRRRIPASGRLLPALGLLIAGGCQDTPTADPSSEVSLAISWETQGIEMASDPVISSEAIFFGTTDGEVIALGHDGALLFRARVPGVPSLRPTVVEEEGDLWVATDQGVSRVDLATGTVRESVSLDPPPRTPVAVAPTVAVVGTDEGIVALRVRDGSEVWRYETPAPVLHRAGTDGERVVVSDRDGTVSCLAAEDGRLLWTRHDGTGYLIAPPEAGSGWFVLAAYEDTVSVVDAATGELLWSRYAGNWLVALPLLHDETVYFAAATGAMYALDATTGDPRWESRGTVWGFQADLFAVGEGVITVGRDGHIVGQARSDGRRLWEGRTPFAIRGAAAVSDRLIVRTEDDTLVALEVPSATFGSEEE